ncbi:MAG: cobalamin biosynthesis protein [Deltaproteobacteria bacterium]|nr:cobalamin biosynthesis protein [Candidatus Tharpella aukensis]
MSENSSVDNVDFDNADFDGSLALYALTAAAAELALAFLGTEAKAQAFILESALNSRFLPESSKNRVTVFPKGAFKKIVSENWQNFAGHLFIMATGIVVRQIAPLLQGKTEDPAVVVCDEKGEFAISLLSGHIGGANRLARKTAAIFNGEAVITTATDVQGLAAIDEIAARKGFKIINPEAIKEINGLLLARKKIAVFGHTFWGNAICSYFDDRVISWSSLSVNVQLLNNSEIAGVVLIDENSSPAAGLPALFLQSPKVVVGIGCRRHTSMIEIEKAVTTVLGEHGIPLSKIVEIVSIDLKKDERGLLDFAAAKKLPIRFFSAADLENIKVPSPSTKVQAVTGSASVSEAAAILAGRGGLLVKKHKFKRVTVAVAHSKNESKEK